MGFFLWFIYFKQPKQKIANENKQKKHTQT